MNIFTHMKGLQKCTFILGLLFSAVGCENNNTDPVDTYAYFPLEVGRYAIYDVREETYSSSQSQPTIRNWQERDEIESVTTDAQGIATYIFSRSTRNTASEFWIKTKEFMVQQYPDKILTTIDNRTYNAMMFPIDTRMTWNGNSYNNLDPEDYHYEDVNKPVQVGTESFDKALSVVERNDSSIINRYMGVKQYGLGVGLISDTQTSFEFCQDEACIGSGKIDSGSRKTRKIVEFGGAK